MNEKVATILMVRYYAYLITRQKYLLEIGGLTKVDEAKMIVSNMNLYHDTTKVMEDGVEIQGYRQILPNLLACENAVRILLSKEECSEE
jgi:hypothetical protein